MKKKGNVAFGRIARKAITVVLVGILSLMGAGSAFADPVVPYWTTPGPVDPIDDNLIKTYGVRDGSAGPDFLGVSNTNFDFTAGSGTSSLQYTGTTAAQMNSVTGAGLAIWATAANVNPNPFYQNLYYNTVTSASATQATTWTYNPIASWGDSNGSWSNNGNVSTGQTTIAGLEYDPEIIFGANKLTNWMNALPNGTNSQTVMDVYFANNPSANYGPTFTSNDATNIWAQVYTMGQLATVADNLKIGTSKVTRYDSNNAMVSAINYEKAIKGNLRYIASQIDEGAVEKKTVAYLYSIDSSGVGYFFTPDAFNMLVGTNTGAAPTNAGNPNANYAADNATIDFGYRATLPFITDTFDSGNSFLGGIIMGVEDIFTANPACTVAALDPVALANVDVIIYNTTMLRGTQLIGVQDGKNISGIDIDVNYDSNFVANWATNHGFTGTLIAGDDFATSTEQGFGVVDTTTAGMAPLLYCQRDYAADKNAKAAWAFAQVYPQLYNGNPDATYCWWVSNIYHIDINSVPTVAAYMLNKSFPIVYDASVEAALNGYFQTGYNWWMSTGQFDPYWSQFAYYNGSSRASYYSNNPLSEEPVDTIGIFAP
jgi:hypothetical protein